jgi:hypothetical protein
MCVLLIMFKGCQCCGELVELIRKLNVIQSGPIKTWNRLSYLTSYMLLSCVMLTKYFCSMMGWYPESRPKKAVEKYVKTKLVSVNQNTNDSKTRLSRLALIAALGKVYSLPSLGSQVTMAHQMMLRKHANAMGFIQPSMLVDPLTIHALKSQSEPLSEVTLEGSFNVIVDTGCTMTATFCKEDFEDLKWLLRPVELVGVGGVTKVHQGSTVKYDCIDSEGNIVTLRCFAYYNPQMEIRLFSPQAFFYGLCKHHGSFTISWAKIFLSLGKHTLPCHIDKESFLPYLTCFHDANKTMQHLSMNHGGITDDNNPNLTAPQCQLLKFHYKLGHLGYQSLQWLLSTGIFRPIGVRCSHNDVTPPKCQACLMGGQHRRPIPSNQHTQKNKGILKAGQLMPVQKVYSNQYVSSLGGRNFTGCGHSQTNVNYKGGTLFADAASSYLSIHHQIGFTAAETIRSKLAFEREAASLGIDIKSYTTDNGVYTVKDFTSELERAAQTIELAGVGAHPQNGPAENAIKNVSRKARILCCMLHSNGLTSMIRHSGH